MIQNDQNKTYIWSRMLLSDSETFGESQLVEPLELTS